METITIEDIIKNLQSGKRTETLKKAKADLEHIIYDKGFVSAGHVHIFESARNASRKAQFITCLYIGMACIA